MEIQICDFVSHVGKFQEYNGIDRREAFAGVHVKKVASIVTDAAIVCGHEIEACSFFDVR